MLLTKAEWMAKHASSAKFQALPKAEKERRYDQYLQSGPNPQFAPKKGAGALLMAKPRTYPQGSYATPRNPPKLGQLKSTRSPSVRSAIESALGSSLPLSPQGHDYLTARFNPFCPHLTNVGYPDPVPGGSRKARGFSEFTVQCNAAGLGFIVCSTDGCASNTTPGVYYSLSNYSGSPGFPVATGAVGTAQSTLAGVPFGTADDPQNSLLWRKLGFGIRIRSETALLQKAGIATSIDFPGSGAGDLLNPTFSDADYRSLFPYWCQAYVLNEGDSPWMSAIWSPKKPCDAYVAPVNSGAAGGNQVNYWDAQNTVRGPIGSTTGATYVYRWDLGICIVGAPNATFQAQVVGYYEYMGFQYQPQMISSITPTYSDPVAVQVGEAATQLTTANAQEKSKDGGLSLSSTVGLISNVAKKTSDVFSTLKGYLPQAPPSTSMLSIEDVSDSAQSLQGYLQDSSMPIIEEIAEEAAPLLLMA